MDASVKQVAPAADHFCDGSVVAKAKTRKRKDEVVMVGARRFLRSDAAKLRQESVNSKYEVPEAAADVACQDSHSCTTSERNSAELNKCAEEVEVQDMGVVFGVEHHKEDQHANKDPAEVIAGKKRNIESFSSVPTDKKLKLESSYFSDGVVAKSGGERKAGRKKVINESSKHDVDEKNASDSESVIPAARPGDGLVDKWKRSIMQRKNSLDYPEIETGKGGNYFQEEVAGILQNQNKKVLGSGGTSRILRSSIRKLGELGSALPESGTVPHSLKDDMSAVLTGKDQLKPRKAKRKGGSRSPETKLKTVDHSVRKYEVKVKVGKACSSEVSPKSKQSACKTEKQKLRDQIKTILLNAGWKIDLRPRKGKSSFDSVYIPPKGCGLWSITKAYEVFLSRLQPRHDSNAELLPEKQSVTSKRRKNSAKGIVTQSPPMPLEAVSMLRRKIFTKRTRKELEAARKKLKINGIQGVASRVRRAIKRSKDINGRNIDKKLEVKDSTSSSTKARFGPSAKKLLAMAGQRKKKNKRSGCALLVRGINEEAETSDDDYVPYVWKRTILSWMIDSGVVCANGKIKYMNKRRTRTILEGQITRDGILCSCCNEVVTVSNFECHAGSKVGQPYENIYVEEARMSLLKCQLNAWEKQEEPERRGFYSIDVTGDDPNDDTCGICGDGGDLICCDCCPSTFHLSCLKIEMLPPGIWHCTYCSCRFCGLASETTQESNSSVLQIQSCLQCEEKFHQQCIPEADADPSNGGLSCISFCGQTCKKTFESLRSLLGIKHDMDDGFSWSLVQRVDEGSSNFLGELDNKRVECNSKVAVALGVMEECFLPIVDQRSGINLIHNVLYNCGSNFNRLNYTGFYTFILEQGDEIISAACVRIHGTRMAEMPFIGTRNMYRRQGMCRLLLNGIEEALRSLHIQKLIIPAISELIHTWTNYFGFKPLDASDKEELKSMNVLVFPGTGLLLKPLLKKDSAPPYGSDIAAGRVELKEKYDQMPEVASSSVHHSSDEVPGGSAKQSLDAETSDVEAIRSDGIISQTCDEVNISLQKNATNN